MSGLYVTFSDEAWEQLKALSRQERRRPQDQAAILIEQAIRAADEGGTNPA